MASFTVRVVNDDQEGMKGERVVLEFRGLTRGMSADEYTNSDGYAEFDDYEEGEVDVYVDGKNYGSYRYEDGGSITITK